MWPVDGAGADAAADGPTMQEYQSDVDDLLAELDASLEELGLGDQ